MEKNKQKTIAKHCRLPGAVQEINLGHWAGRSSFKRLILRTQGQRVI